MAVLVALRAAIIRHKDHPDGLVESVFMPAFAYLVKRKDWRWINAANHNPNKDSLFRDLNSEQADFVLENLISFPRIEYRAEEVLTSIAHRWANKVVDFFGDRIKYLARREKSERYDAVPFELQH